MGIIGLVALLDGILVIFLARALARKGEVE